MPSKLSQFWQELKRRNVVRVITVYAASAFVILELVDILAPSLGLPAWTLNLVLIILCIGFIVAIILSWIYDLTSTGLEKTEPLHETDTIVARSEKRKLKVSDGIIALLLLVVCILLYPKIFKNEKLEELKDRGGEFIELIAVLPFSNTKPDPETDYLGFAIADRIIGNLVYLKNIAVRPSSSIRKYENQVIDPTFVCDDLKVDYVLTGNYLKEGDLIRMNVELVKGKTKEMIWRSDQIEVDFQNAFELQDIVAQEVVEEMHVQFSQKELNRIKKDIPNNPLAYEYYLRSISYPYTTRGDQLAIQMLHKSIELDSSFAPAHSHLGYRIKRLSEYGLFNPEETNKAENSLLKALSLNGTLLSALGTLANIYTETNRVEKALKLTEQMLDINPNNAEAHYSLGYIFRFAGMLTESISEMEKAVALEPQNSRFRTLGITYINMGEYEKALDALEVYEESPFAMAYKGMVLLRQNHPNQAVDYFNRVIDMEHETLWRLVSIANKAYIEGSINEGLMAISKLEQANVTDAEAWYSWASLYALLGDREGCIRSLQKAVDGGYYNYPFMIIDSYLDSMRNDPEFQIILEEAKNKHLAFKERYLN